MKHKPKKAKLILIPSILIFSLIAVFGISFFTGNQNHSNVGTSEASAQEPADINNDSAVNVFDLSILLGKWNTADPLSDLNKDGTVNVFDLSMLLSKWGPVGGTVGECTPPTVGPGGYPLPNLIGYANSCNTGARHACTSTHTGTFSTSGNGQVIQDLCIQGTLRINHDNVTVRDVTIAPTLPVTYLVDIGRNFASLKTAPACPVGLNIEYTTVDYSAVGATDWGVYQRCHPATGVHRFDHVKIENIGRGMLMGSDPCSITTENGICNGELNNDYTGGNLIMTNSYIYAQYNAVGAHRSGLSTHGGDNYTVTGNTFICAGANCSSSVNLYHDYWAVSNYTFQNNVVAGGSICLRADISDANLAAFGPLIHDIKVLNNRFSTIYAPQCGSLQAFIFYSAAPGSVRSGNIWHENGLPITGE